MNATTRTMLALAVLTTAPTPLPVAGVVKNLNPLDVHNAAPVKSYCAGLDPAGGGENYTRIVKRSDPSVIAVIDETTPKETIRSIIELAKPSLCNGFHCRGFLTA